jgi:hypothetical protein
MRSTTYLLRVADAGYGRYTEGRVRCPDGRERPVEEFYDHQEHPLVGIRMKGRLVRGRVVRQGRAFSLAPERSR